MLLLPPQRALVIGNDNYIGANLTYCMRDAEQIGQLLSLPEFGFQVEYLLDPYLTRNRLTDELEKFFSQEATAYIVYYSGHGFKSRFSCHFVTSELTPLEYNRGLHMDFLNNLIVNAANPSAAILIILDCCHAGAFVVEEGISRPFVTTQHIKESIKAGNGRAVLAACLESQLTTETSTTGSGLYTSYLLEGLLGAARNRKGQVTVSTLNAYVAASLSAIGGPTTLFEGHYPGDMVLGTPAGIATEATGADYALERLPELEEQSGRYRQIISELMHDFNDNPLAWRTSAFSKAAKELPTFLTWFDNANHKHQTILRNSTVFAANRNFARLAREYMASSLVEGLEVSRGLIQKEIGSGGFGTVWLVEAQNGETWAYKTSHSSVFHETDKVHWFLRGFGAMSQLEHANIVRVRAEDWTEAPMGFYMEYVAGDNWRKYAPASHLAFDEIIEQLIVLAEALKYAHSRAEPVYHRDIKPENILVGYDSVGKVYLKLTDFDLAWYSAYTTIKSESSRAMMLFLLYASPEFIENPYGKATEKPTTDIYSLGQLILFAFTNRDPNPAIENATILEREIRRMKPSVDASDLLLALYKRCTQKSTEARFQSMAELLVALREVQLASVSGLTDVTPRTFLRQVIMVLDVLETANINDLDAIFSSPSGNFRFVLTLDPEASQKNARATLHCTAEQTIVVVGVKTYRNARDVLYSRLQTNILRTFPSKRINVDPTHDKIFGAEIKLLKVELSQRGIKEIVNLIKEAIRQLDG